MADASSARLQVALTSARRRFRLPPLPDSADAARRAGVHVALAWAIERGRIASQHVAPPVAAHVTHQTAGEARALFTWALGELVRCALGLAGDATGDGGDPAYQAEVLRRRDPQVRRFAELDQQAEQARRSLKALLDPVAHPGKLRSSPQGAARDALQQLHEQASSGAWAALARHTHALRVSDNPELVRLRPWLQALETHPGLAALAECEALLQQPEVQRHDALLRQATPPAGSEAALRQGSAANRRGATTEAATVQALQRVAQRLDEADGAARHHVVARLLVPAALPGSPDRAKSEWDAALLRRAADDAGDQVVLLVEAKASPDAASSDLPRLLRGLQRLSQADAHERYRFRCSAGEVTVSGASLQALQPHDHALPDPVIYCCDAASDAGHVLSASARSMLLNTPACIAFAARLAQGERPSTHELDPLWHELLHARALRPVLHQYDNARTVRDAMLHPHDLLAALASD